MQLDTEELRAAIVVIRVDFPKLLLEKADLGSKSVFLKYLRAILRRVGYRRRRQRNFDDVITIDKENCEMKKGIFVVLALLAISTVPEIGNTTTQRERDYLRLVMDVFRSHVEAIELLTDDPGKYSDNVVRHANAIANTAGLLDHAFPGNRNTEGNSHWPWQNEAEFDKLASVVQIATKELATAAQYWLKDQDRAKFIAALERVKESCRACHGTARNWP